MRARILTKSGKQVSYQLEAYSFVEDDRHYMMGVGINIKSQLKVERNLEKAIDPDTDVIFPQSCANLS